MNIVYWGNSEFSLRPLELLAKHYPVSAVVTAPDTFVGRGQKTPRLNPIKEFALSHAIPLIQTQKLKNNDELVQQLKALDADLFVLVSYGKIVPESIFTLPSLGMINLHASLLPSLRGASPIQFALWQGLEETGNTVQYIAKGMDEGDVLAQRSLAILPHDDYFSLEAKLSEDGSQLLLQTVQAMEKGLAQSLPQNHDVATYCTLISKEDGLVDFSMTTDEIVRAYKALKHFPGVMLSLDLGLVKILNCSLAQGQGQAGEILEISADGILLACYEGALLIKELQASGKKACHARDFVNGLRLKKGDFLK